MNTNDSRRPVHLASRTTAALFCALLLWSGATAPAGAAVVHRDPTAVTAVSAVSGVFPKAAAGDLARVGFGVVPANAKGVDRRAFFSYGLAPGATAYDHVAFLNYSKAPLVLGVRTADALNTDDGGYAVEASAAAPRDLGAWVSVSGGRRTVTVPGRAANGTPGRTIVPVTITIPATASPGDHAAGVLAILSTNGTSGGQKIRFEQRVAARVYVTVAGPQKPALTVTLLRADFTPGRWPWERGRVKVDYEVVNSGNVRMGFDPTLRLSGPAGLGATRLRPGPVAELLPRNSQTLTTTVQDVWPLGLMGVRLSAEPKAAPATERPDIGQVTRTERFWAVTWWQLAGLLVVVLAAVIIGRRRRRATTERAPSASPRQLAGVR